MDEFHYNSYAQEVIFGAGSLNRLSESVANFGCQRFMLCANHSMRVSGHLTSIENILGDRLVAVFDQVQPHVQDVQFDEVLALAAEKNVDALIGMGGGSPIGMAKAASAALEKNAGTAFPVIAIPTTYAGSEMTPVYGITHTKENPPRKVTSNNPKSVPKLVIYDPNLTLDLPPSITASTGINALAHCTEALYSIKRNPLSTAVATAGVHHIFDALLRCYKQPDDLEARTEMMLGAHLAGLSLASVTMGLHHGLCHVLGGTANVPHGIANSIILPHAVRFNASATAMQLLPVAAEMEIPIVGIKPIVAIEAMVQKLFHFISQMHLPQHLRDAGVGLQESDLPYLAEIAFHNRTVQNNPKPITNEMQIAELLRDAW
ncbi:MAG: iron-containing alcohol dehydrogenase [Anaerolineae bacterium]|nr:iron-containing alcohol dehydrogenase [Anaerolineae bacterium]MCI0608096.1 iron-containing alcohol dehydrogenase [Anaerolineae bacterium]